MRQILFLLVLLIAGAADASDAMPVAALGERVRVHVRGDDVVQGTMVGQSSSRVLVRDWNKITHEIARRDVEGLEVYVGLREPRGSNLATMTAVFLTAAFGLAMASASDDDVISGMSGSVPFGLAITLIGAPAVGYVTYQATTSTPEASWAPARFDVARTHGGAPRPVGVTLSGSF